MEGNPKIVDFVTSLNMKKEKEKLIALFYLISLALY